MMPFTWCFPSGNDAIQLVFSHCGMMHCESVFSEALLNNSFLFSLGVFPLLGMMHCEGVEWGFPKPLGMMPFTWCFPSGNDAIQLVFSHCGMMHCEAVLL